MNSRVQKNDMNSIKTHIKIPSIDIVLMVLLVLLTFFLRWESRFQTVWEWDEAQFALGIREYDVSLHHPHLRQIYPLEQLLTSAEIKIFGSRKGGTD